MRTSLFKFLSRYDDFGHPISLNYNKDEDYKTWCGTSASMIKFILLIAYLTHISYVCISRKDPWVQYNVRYHDFENTIMSPEELAYDVAFELFTSEEVNN